MGEEVVVMVVGDVCAESKDDGEVGGGSASYFSTFCVFFCFSYFVLLCLAFSSGMFGGFSFCFIRSLSCFVFVFYFHATKGFFNIFLSSFILSSHFPFVFLASESRCVDKL